MSEMDISIASYDECRHNVRSIIARVDQISKIIMNKKMARSF